MVDAVFCSLQPVLALPFQFLKYVYPTKSGLSTHLKLYPFKLGWERKLRHIRSEFFHFLSKQQFYEQQIFNLAHF